MRQEYDLSIFIQTTAWMLVGMCIGTAYGIKKRRDAARKREDTE